MSTESSRRLKRASSVFVQPDPEASRVVRFGPFVLDLQRNRLLRGGDDLRLRAKTWTVLCYLAERRGSVVGKDQLLRDVWPDVVVTEETLTKSITEIRRALGDDPRAPLYLRTVHGRGFCFLDSDEAGASPPAKSRTEAVLDAGFATNRDRMVGRKNEMAVLSRAWAAARDGGRQLVFVTGEAGIGKSTLVDAFLQAALAQPDPAWSARGCCIEQHGTQEAYFAMLDALEGLLRPPAAAPLRELLRRYAPTWSANLPWLRDDAPVGSPLVVDDLRPERMLREFSTFIEAASAVQPLVLLLEDLHWSDPATVDLLFMLAQRREPARLLIIGTYRPAELVVRDHPLASVRQTLRARQQSREIALEGLTVVDVRDYLGQRCPGADSDELAAFVHAHTDGMPLFVVALVEDFIQRGWLIATEPGWVCTVPPARIDATVPDDVRELIRSQLESLRPRERSLLEAASVAGIDFGVPEVAAALGSTIEAAEKLCHRLASSYRFLRVADGSSLPDGSASRCHRFRHALHRQVIYDDLPETRRRNCHQRIAAVLEHDHGAHSASIVGRLAMHFQCAGDAPRAIHYLAAAAKAASGLCAPRQAITNLESALELLGRVSDEGERRRRGLALRLQLGPSLNAVHGYASQAVRDNYDAALALCDAETPGELRQAVLYPLWYSHLMRAERDEARRTAGELVAQAARLGAAERWLAESALARTDFYAGELVAARARLERLRATWSGTFESEEKALFGPAPLVVVLGHLAEVLWALGYPDQARTIAAEALSRAELDASRFTLAVGLFHCVLQFQLRNEPDQCVSLNDRLTAVARENGFEHWVGPAAAVSGWVLSRAGDPAAGLPQIRSGLAGVRASGSRVGQPNVLAILAETLGQLGSFDAALAAADEGLALTETTLDAWLGPELWRVRGVVLAQRARRRRRSAGGREDAQAAERCMRRSLELARSMGSLAFELRAALGLAELLAARGARAEGRALVGPIYDRFTEGKDTDDLHRAAAFMAA